MDESNFFMAYKGKRSSHAHAGALQSWNDGNVHSNFNLYKRRQAQFGANPEARNAPTSETIWNLPCHILSHLVTSCHILSHLVTTSSVSGMQRHRRRHMRPPARPERHCTDLTPLNALAEPSVIPHEHLTCMNLSHKMSQDVSIEFHWYISIHPGPVLPISPSIQRMLTCSRSANSLQDTTSAMAIQPPQWSRLYI